MVAKLGNLQNLLGFHLRIAHSRVFKGLTTAVSPPGLRVQPGEVSLLSLIYHNPGLRQQDLADTLELDKSTVAPLLKKLEEQQLIRRDRVEEDRRAARVSLSETGRALFRELEINVRVYENSFAADLSAEERVELIRLLGKIRKKA